MAHSLRAVVDSAGPAALELCIDLEHAPARLPRISTSLPPIPREFQAVSP